jgi:hypothetical protein
MLSSIKAYFEKVRQRIKSRIDGRTSTIYKIKHNPKGMNVSFLTIENESGSNSIFWKNVEKVTTFKRDLFTVDMICLQFHLNDEIVFEINEEMKGWDELTKLLPEYLPGCKKWEEWFMNVFSPAFETNLATIYLRKITEQIAGEGPGKIVGF